MPPRLAARTRPVVDRYDRGYTIRRMKTAISLPDPLFRAADELAARLGVSRSELFQRAMERFLRDYDDEGTTQALNAVYSAEPAAVDPVLARLQVASLEPEDW